MEPVGQPPRSTGVLVGPGELSDRGSSAKETLSDVTGRARSETRGNPLAAGLMAFEAGLLMSGLIPSSLKEQEAIGRPKRRPSR